MLEFPVSLIGGTVGLILGLILGGYQLSERLKNLRRLIEDGVREPGKTDWNVVAAEVKGIEQDARSLVALLRRVVGR